MFEPEGLRDSIILQSTIDEQKRIVVISEIRIIFSVFGHNHTKNFEMFQITRMSFFIFAKSNLGDY